MQVRDSAHFISPSRPRGIGPKTVVPSPPVSSNPLDSAARSGASKGRLLAPLTAEKTSVPTTSEVAEDRCTVGWPGPRPRFGRCCASAHAHEASSFGTSRRCGRDRGYQLLVARKQRHRGSRRTNLLVAPGRRMETEASWTGILHLLRSGLAEPAARSAGPTAGTCSRSWG